MSKSPEQFNLYSEKEAQKEAQKMQEKIARGEARDYSEAEKQVEADKKYDPDSEYHVDLENPEVKEKIEQAQKLYREFLQENFEKFDLSKEQSIDDVYNKAVEAGVFDKAKEIRELLFGKDVHFYGVSYLWDACVNHCHYCPGSVPNRAKAIKE